MITALGVGVMAFGGVLLWSSIVNADALAEIRAALTGDPSPRASSAAPVAPSTGTPSTPSGGSSGPSIGGSGGTGAGGNGGGGSWGDGAFSPGAGGGNGGGSSW